MGSALAPVRPRRRRVLGARRRGGVRDRRRPAGRATASLPRTGPRRPAARSCSTRATSPRSIRAGPARRTVSGSLTSTAGRGRPGTRSSTQRTRRCGAIRAASSASTSRTARSRGSSSPPASRGERVHRIPIGIELDAFPLTEPDRREAARRAFGLPHDAFVVGSFVKDGEGFGDGLEPKPIKGPDVLVETLAELGARIPDVVVLLTGPARGYVRRKLGRPRDPAHPPAPRAGGPRPGVPRPRRLRDRLASGGRPEEPPRVDGDGDPARHDPCRAGAGPRGRRRERHPRRRRGRVEGSRAGSQRVRDDTTLVARFREAGRRTAEENSHRALAPRWSALLDGFAERADG